jgi:hypothetical protein
LKKTIILCDRCEQEIPGTMKICIDNTTNRCVGVEGDRKYSDVCPTCAGEIMWMTYWRAPTAAQLYNEAQEKSEKISSNTANLSTSGTSNYHEIDGWL